MGGRPVKGRLALLGALVLLVLGPESALAQQVAPPAPVLKPSDVLSGPPASPSSPGAAAAPSSSNVTVSAPVLSQEQANGLFEGALLDGFQKLANHLRDGVQRLASETDLIGTTAPSWTYQQPTILAIQGGLRAVANAALAVVIFWIGFVVVTSPVLQDGLVEARVLFGRVTAAVVLVNSTGVWAPLLVDLNNGLCRAVLEVGTPTDAVSLAALFGIFPLPFGDVLLLLLGLAFLLVFVWLYLKMAYRLAIVMLALAVAPLVPLLWVLPQTQSWVARWNRLFWPRLYGQVGVVAALKLALAFPLAAGTNPVVLLVTLALVLAAANAPELLWAAGGVALGPALRLAGMAASAAGATAAPLAAGAASAGSASAGAGGDRGSRVGVSGMNHGTGGGTAVQNRFGRGGRRLAAA